MKKIIFLLCMIGLPFLMMAEQIKFNMKLPHRSISDKPWLNSHHDMFIFNPETIFGRSGMQSQMMDMFIRPPQLKDLMIGLSVESAKENSRARRNNTFAGNISFSNLAIGDLTLSLVKHPKFERQQARLFALQINKSLMEHKGTELNAFIRGATSKIHGINEDDAVTQIHQKILMVGADLKIEPVNFATFFLIGSYNRSTAGVETIVEATDFVEINAMKHTNGLPHYAVGLHAGYTYSETMGLDASIANIWYETRKQALSTFVTAYKHITKRFVVHIGVQRIFGRGSQLLGSTGLTIKT